MRRRGLVLAASALPAVLSSCAGAILARGRGAKGGRLLARDVAVLGSSWTPKPGTIVSLDWSPDGSQIAAVGFGEYPLRDSRSQDAMLWGVPERRLIATVPRAQHWRFALAFMRDSRLLVMPAARAPGTPVSPPSGPDHLSLVDARTGAVVGAAPSGLPPPPPGGPPHDIAVAPVGDRAAAVFPGRS